MIITITIALPFKLRKYSISIFQSGILKRKQFHRNPGTKGPICFSKLISMRITHIIIVSLFFIGLSSPLYAAPEDLDTFLDFESITGEGDDFIIGDSPNSVRVIGFTIKMVDDPNFAHSGTRALVLNPNAEEGKIIFERGVNLLQFYAAESFGAGRIELRDKNFLILSPQGITDGLPTNINPANNISFLNYVAYSGNFLDVTDLNFTNGIKEIKVTNAPGIFVIDDLGYSYIEGPPNNTIFEDFEIRIGNPVFADIRNFTIGDSPNTATFIGGIATSTGIQSFNHTSPIGPNQFFVGGSWLVENDKRGTITFNIPAAQVQFYSAVFIKGDGEIKIFDTNDNLLTSTNDIPQTIRIDTTTPFDFFDFNAVALGAPEGIGKITFTNSPEKSTQGNISDIVFDDFGYTPITATFVADDLINDGSGIVIGTNIEHPNGNTFDQILLTGQSITIRADAGQITRVSFIDENDDIVQAEFSGAGTVTINIDPETFSGPARPINYNQNVDYVKGRPSFIIQEADNRTFFSVFTVGLINAVNQSIFPPATDYDGVADVAFLEVIDSSGIGGIQCANTRFSDSKGKVGIDAASVPIATQILVGDIDAIDEADPFLLFGGGSFFTPSANPGMRITGGDLTQSNGKSIIVASGGSEKGGFSTLIAQNNFKSDGTPQPTQAINATFINEDGDNVFIIVVPVTVE